MANDALISRATLASQARRALLGRILDRRIAPGERLNEARAALQLGVSRTPVREALAALAREGFLSGEPGKGYVVAPLTQDEANELYPILGVLEGMAVRTAKLSSADLAELEQLNNALSQVGAEPEQAINANFAWHERLLDHCANERLASMIRGLWLQVRRYEFGFYAPGKVRVRQSVELHRGIAEALQRGARTQAAKLMEEHWLTDLGALLPRIGGDASATESTGRI